MSLDYKHNTAKNSSTSLPLLVWFLFIEHEFLTLELSVLKISKVCVRAYICVGIHTYICRSIFIRKNINQI